MTAVAARRLYLALVHLHPRGFKRSFGDEMLQIFDEGGETYGAAWLIWDAAQSLARQWLVRPPDVGRLSGADERIGLLAGTYPVVWPPHLTAGKLLGAFVLSLSLVLLIQPYQLDRGQPLQKEVRHGRAQAHLLGRVQ